MTGNEKVEKEKVVGSTPETRALQDEFTKEFVTSQEEVQEGYYQFKSRTDGYTMLFPKEGKISKSSFESNKDIFETYTFGENVTEDNLAFYYKIIYDANMLTKEVQPYLNSLSRYAGYEGEYETFEHEGKTYYYAEDITEAEGNKAYDYFSFIISNESNQAVTFFSSSSCKDFNQSCNPEQSHIKDKFLMMMKSVDFLD
ncbi:hypothetical protein [Cytobacillus horneckiae]|uniref:hypothetical protein n=2 Tax=Bacteria TaxID=2 RepID=UPI003D9A9A76